MPEKLFDDSKERQMYKLNHSSETTYGAFGISEERMMMLDGYMERVCDEGESVSGIIERVANSKELNSLEKMFCIYMFGTCAAYNKLKRKEAVHEIIMHEIKGANVIKLSEIIDMLSKDGVDEPSLPDILKKIHEIMKKK